ncbi:MAG: hypothetical protein ABN502_13870 [Gammaproteobacteria bacterium]
MECIGFWKGASLVVAAMIVSGCTTITIAAGSDQVVVSSLTNPRIKVFGLAPVAIRARGLGMSRTPRSFNLGWYSETGIYAPDKEGACRIVLLSNNQAELQELLDVLQGGGADLSSVCIDRSIDPQGASR